ncbi:MAG: hypothetical protein ACLSHU_07370 [Oscillospiraceae bacterium]
MNPQFLKYDPIASSGVNVGYNPTEQTVGPGEKIQYLWHADREYGAALLTSFGDLRNHRHHGLFGAILIEPPKAKYYRGIRPDGNHHGEQAVITAPGVEPYREFVLFAHNGIRLLDRDGALIKTTEQGGEHGVAMGPPTTRTPGRRDITTVPSGSSTGSGAIPCPSRSSTPRFMATRLRLFCAAMPGSASSSGC